VDEQKENWLNLCADLLQHAEVDDNFVKYIAMGVGMWVCGYDVELKQHSPQ
jgi:hypothetical protein